MDAEKIMRIFDQTHCTYPAMQISFQLMAKARNNKFIMSCFFLLNREGKGAKYASFSAMRNRIHGLMDAQGARS